MSDLFNSVVAWQQRLTVHVHELWPDPVDEGTQAQASLPGGGQVRHLHVPVAFCLFLTPSQQPARPDF